MFTNVRALIEKIRGLDLYFFVIFNDEVCGPIEDQLLPYVLTNIS
jgi:hypothetical protein